MTMKKMGRPKLPIKHHVGHELWHKIYTNKKKPHKEAELIPVDDPTYQDCRVVLEDLYEKVGPSECIRVLTKFECDRLSDMDPKHFTRFIAHCKELMGYR